MRSLVVLAATVFAFAAAQQRIAVTPACADPLSCPLTLSAGLDQSIQFSLVQPIVCDASSNRECAVVVLVTNSHPKLVSVDPCMVKWTSNDWFQKRYIRLRAVQNFNSVSKDVGQQVTVKTEPAISPALYYDKFDPYDIVAIAPVGGSAQCSAVGDPHYTTFDGMYWHYYDGNNRARTVMHLVKSTNPTRPGGSLQVQTQVRGNPATHCAMAGREAYNVVIIDVCGGSLTVRSILAGPAATQPRVEASGATYTVYFNSGFWMRAVSGGYYLNVYAQVPGIDYNNVCGMCGNFNGNANDDNPVYQATAYSQLFPCQQVDLNTDDLWSWTAPATIPTLPPLPSGAVKCNYTEPVFIPPILNNAAGTDISDDVRQTTINALNNRTTFTFAEPSPAPVVDHGITADLARAECIRVITQSNAVQTCNRTFSNLYDFPRRIDSCVQDVVDAQDYHATAGVIVAMTVACAERAVQEGLASEPALMNVLCLNACYGNGNCFNAQCQCFAGFGNPDCSYVDGKPAHITGLYDTVCEVSGVGACPRELAVTGTNFYKSNFIRCRYGQTVVPAVWLGGNAIICAVPMQTYMNTEYETVQLQVTNDYTNDAEWSNPVPFIFYNGACWNCNAKNQTCGPNPASCRINNQCYLAGTTNDPDNTCQVCNPAKSSVAWSYSYDNTLMCGPVFTQREYDYTIYCNARANTPLITASALNARLTNDPSAKITYSLKPSIAGSTAPTLFAVNNATGVIYPTQDIDFATLSGGMAYNAQNPNVYNGFFLIQARDSVGNLAEANVLIQLRGTAADGTCNAPVVPKFNATVPEDIAVGTQLLTVKQNVTGTITYSWWYEDGAAGTFAINAATGNVSVAKALDFETKRYYHLQAKLTDSTGLWYLADVYINVTNVNEPPSNIQLSGTSVSEDANNTVVGSIAVTDPEGGPFTLALTTGGAYFFIDLSSGTPQLKTKVGISAHPPSNIQSVDVTIRATDPTSLSYSKTITITITKVNQPPGQIRLVQLASNDAVTSFPESYAAGETVARVLATDPDGDAYQCGVTNSDDTTFEIYYDGTTNFLRLLKPADYESNRTRMVQIRCADIPASGAVSAISPVATMVLDVTDVNEAPSSVKFTQTVTVTENAVPPSPLNIGTITGIDLDSLPAGFIVNQAGSKLKFNVTSPMGVIRIDQSSISCTLATAGSTGQVCTATLQQLAALDYEAPATPGQQPVVIRAEDPAGVWAEFTVYVTVQDVNEAPTGVTFAPDANPNVVEGSPVDTVITTVTANDQDIGDTQTFTLTANPNNALKLGPASRRRASSMAILVNNPDAFDFETNPTITFSLRVTDSKGLSLVVTKTIAVTDRPMTVTADAVAISEGLAVGGKVARLTLNNYDTPADAISWFRIQPDVDLGRSNNEYFNRPVPVPGSNPPQADLTLAKNLDYDAGLRSVIAGIGISFASNREPVNQRITFQVTNVNEPPAFSAVSYTSPPLMPGSPAGTVVLASSAADPEGSALTYTLSGPASAYLSVNSNGNIVVSGSVPVTYGGTTPLTITASDATGLVATAHVTIVFGTACSANPCGDRGSCQICRIPTLGNSGSGVVDCAGSLLNVAKGYQCACNSGRSGLNCEFTTGSTTITVVIVPNPPVPLTATLTPQQEEAVKSQYLALTGLTGTVPPSQLTVTLTPNNAGVMVLTITRQSVSGATAGETALSGTTFTFAYTNTVGGQKTTVQGSGSATVPSTVYTAPSTGQNSNGSSSSSGGLPSGAVAAIVVGIILLLILVVIVVLLVRKQNSAITFDKDGENALYASSVNPTFMAAKTATGDFGGAAAGGKGAAQFQIGMSNPSYDWYQPSMSRKECTNYLLGQGEGAFVIRDSAATPGWHMLGVKTSNEVLHEKIRFTEDGQYELMPTKSTGKQPRFRDLPALVDFYLNPQGDMPYTLACSNPIYDNHQLKQTKVGYAMTGNLMANDPAAPSLPLREKEVDQVAALARTGSVRPAAAGSADEEQDLYTNTAEAKAALTERSNYKKMAPGDAGYLLSGNGTGYLMSQEYRGNAPAETAGDIGYLSIDPSGRAH